MTEDQRSRLSGFGCGVLAGLAVLLSLPFAEMGFIDDWSYIRTAHEFARTGHFIFNGWATAMLGWQILWSAPFLKVFGYSFTVARLSMLPFACGCGWLLHAILRHGNVSNRNAVFRIAHLVPLSPVSSSRRQLHDGHRCAMRHPVCMYLCQRALEASSDRAAIAWLCAATVISIAAGTERQIMWLGALVMVPSAAWLLRKRRGMIPATAMLWAVSVVMIFLLARWFYHQPYSVPEKLFYTRHQEASASLTAVLLEKLAFKAVSFPAVLLETFLCLLLLILPILIAWLAAARMFGRPTQIKLGVLALLLGMGYWIRSLYGPLEDWLMPWLHHVLLSEAIAAKSWVMLGDRPVALSNPVRAGVSILVILSGVAFAQWCVSFRRKNADSRSPGSWPASWKSLLSLYLPYSIAYLMLLVPRGLRFYIFRSISPWRHARYHPVPSETL